MVAIIDSKGLTVTGETEHFCRESARCLEYNLYNVIISYLHVSRRNSLLNLRDNVHSHLRHANRPMAVRGGGGLSNGRFPWTKWDFRSEVKKL